MARNAAEGLKEAIRVDQSQRRGHIFKAVRSSVEETLNPPLQVARKQICGARHHMSARYSE